MLTCICIDDKKVPFAANVSDTLLFTTRGKVTKQPQLHQ